LLAVTTFNPKSLTEYAQNCLDGLKRCFPGKIVAYTEEHIGLDGIDERDFFSIPGVGEYLEKIKKVACSDGNTGRGYDYRWDANKFCRKVFCQEAVFDEDRFVFWIDADCVFKKPLPTEFLEGLLDGSPFCYLGRMGRDAYTETGFLGFDTKHTYFPEFRKKYLSYFLTGRIFSEKNGWHDCIAFDRAREGIKGKNLCPTGSGMGAVIGKTPLAEYMDHWKGNRKFNNGSK